MILIGKSKHVFIGNKIKIKIHVLFQLQIGIKVMLMNFWDQKKDCVLLL